MYNMNQPGPMGPYPGMNPMMGPQMGPPIPQANMMTNQQLQPFPQPNLAHPMNQPYPYPIPVQAPLPAQPPFQQPPQMPMQQPQYEQPPMQYQQQPPMQPHQPPRPQPPRNEPPRYEPPYRPERPPLKHRPDRIRDFGPQPFVIDIEQASIDNDNYRTALWTGEHLQVTLMSIDVNDDIGVEIHPHTDQFIRIEEGQGVALIGDRKDDLNMQSRIKKEDAIMIPAGKWHNVVNTGPRPLKLYSIYAPVQHPHGTVQHTNEDAMKE